MQLSSLLLTAAVSLAGFQAAPAGEDVTIDVCVVKLIDEVKLPADLPSQEAGVLTVLRTEVVGANGQRSLERVRAGMSVVEGQVLGQIDDQLAGKMREVAQYKLEIAKKEAGNEVSVDYAQAAWAVADADYLSAEKANTKRPGDGSTDGTPADGPAMQAVRAADRAGPEYELDIAKVSVKAQQAQLEASEHDLARRKIISPINGVIVDVYPHEKEWLHPRRSDRTYCANGSTRGGRAARSTLARPAVVAGNPVTVTADLPDGRQHSFKGRIDFVSPLVDGDERLTVRAVVMNQPDRVPGEWLLRPGRRVKMTIGRR